MLIFKVVGLALTVLMILIVLREKAPELALLLVVAAALVFFFSVITYLEEVLGLLEELAVKGDVNLYYVRVVLKVIGIAYISELGAQICRDAGEGALASKVEMVAKVVILAVAIPVIKSLLEVILEMLPAV